MGQSEVRQLQPAAIEHERAWIQSQVLHRMLLIEVVENLGRGPDVIDQFASHDARLLQTLTFEKSVSQRFLDKRDLENEPARFGVNHLRGQQARMLQRGQADAKFLQLLGVRERAAIDELHQLGPAFGRLRLPRFDEWAVLQTFHKALAGQQSQRQSRRSRSVPALCLLAGRMLSFGRGRRRHLDIEVEVGHGVRQIAAPFGEEGSHQVLATGVTLLGILLQGPLYDGPIGFRQRLQIGLLMGMLHQQLASVLPVERQRTGEQFLINNGQTVLIAMPAEYSLEKFRCRVQRRNGAGLNAHLMQAQTLHQAEIRDLDVIADKEQVARLDVEVLQIALNIKQVEHLGDFAHVKEQLQTRQTGLA